MPAPSDGKVRVESAKLAEMKDFKVLPVGHTWMVNNPDVISAAQHFIEHGQFK